MTAHWNSNEASGSSEVAREGRTSKLVAIELSSPRHARQRVVIRNLSRYGIGLRGELDLLVCERVVLHLPGNREVGATVRWARKGTFGLSLDEAIDPSELQAKVASDGHLTTRDAQQGFVPFKPQMYNKSQGFLRTHRDQVLDGTSHWVED